MNVTGLAVTEKHDQHRAKAAYKRRTGRAANVAYTRDGADWGGLPGEKAEHTPRGVVGTRKAQVEGFCTYISELENADTTLEPAGMKSGSNPDHRDTRAMPSSGVVLTNSAQGRRWMPPTWFEATIAHRALNRTARNIAHE